MNWHDEWTSVAARIDGLLNAAQFFVHTLNISSEDAYGVADKHVAEQAREIVSNLSSFLASHRVAIPQGATVSLDRFLEKSAAAIKDPNVKGLQGLKLRITALAALCAEVEYHLSDFEAVASKKAERAFLHLQQSIVVDEAVRGKWQNAFERGEVECEQLGAAHLMLQGIWAFKVNAQGARTDLVFGDVVANLTRISRVADALVLTEWKKVKELEEVEVIAKTARAQIQLYTAGVLGGIELSRYRYVVLVSQKQFPTLEDVQQGSSICRHINIAVTPITPSRAAMQ